MFLMWTQPEPIPAYPCTSNEQVIGHIGSDFGELEDPTPWEIQEAIRRIKERERRRGAEQAKSEVTSLRSYEYVEMEQRVRAAMQRISELEGIVQRDPSIMIRGSPMRNSLGPGAGDRSSMMMMTPGGGGGQFASGGPIAPSLVVPGSLGATGGSLGSPMGGRIDDVRAGIKDKSLRRGMRGQSPRSSFSRMGSVPDK